MAKTQEFYRLGSRLPRYTTKLTTQASGMYLTNQVIPEGYAKVMINYDIDDTGSNIKPRNGRRLVQEIKSESDSLGAVSMTDYLYTYNPKGDSVDSTRDVVMSYGTYITPQSFFKSTAGLDNINPLYIGRMRNTVDTNMYDEEGNIITPGTITSKDSSDFWALYYNINKNKFERIKNENIGSVLARTITNAYAFNKPFTKPVGRPIGTVVNNELLTFAGPAIVRNYNPSNTERNEVVNLTAQEFCKLQIYGTESDLKIKRQVLKPRQLNVLEASTAGYNILAAQPYVFTDEEGTGLDTLGILIYNTKDNSLPIFSPIIGEAATYRLYYQYPADTQDPIYVKIDTLDLTDDKATWVVHTDFPHEGSTTPTKQVTAGDPINFTYNSKTAKFAIRFTLRKGTDDSTDVAMYRPVTCGDIAYEGIELRNFNLKTCKGMINWQGCVGVYGVENALNTIFFSDTEDPSYFPFPNNVITFDNDILAVHSYLDYLLVITVDSLWLVEPNATIKASIQKRILANVHIPEVDAMNLVVLKDQIFFKTDTQFYVLKPNQYTSDATDLKNYVNSTAIANYTANFKVETVKMLNEVYKDVWQTLTKEQREHIIFEDFDVLDTISVIRNEEVHYIYTIKPILTNNIILDNLNLHLVYNTLTRSWRMYFVAVGSDSVSYNPILYRNKQSGVFYEFFPHTTSNNAVLTISEQTKDTVTDGVEGTELHLTKYYNNYTYLDTGNVSIDDVDTKRFREVQFNLMNMEHTLMSFYVDFKLDGQERVSATKYEMQHIVDPQDPDYGNIYVTPLESSNLDLPGLTTLAEDVTESDHFALDISKFPDLNVATIRFRLQGRGRRAAIQLLNTSLKSYELSDMNWVYRIMSAR